MIFITCLLGAVVGHMSVDFVAYFFHREAHPVLRFVGGLVGALASGFLYLHFNDPTP